MKNVSIVTSEYFNRHKRQEAQRSMTGSERAVYMYFVDMAETCGGDSFPLEVAQVTMSTGIGRASYFRAMQGLTEKGFVKQEARTIYFDAVGRLKE